MTNSLIQLLVLAGVALFLILKLRSVLGTRDGFERPAEPLAPPLPDAARRASDTVEAGPDRDIVDHVPEGSPSAEALTAMKRIEPSFSVGGFLQGARGAYEMILKGFAKGDIAPMRPYMSPEVAESFEKVFEDRKMRGLTLSTDVLGIRELALDKAEFDRSTQEAELTVRFGSELISATTDATGGVVEGDPKKARKQKDVWTFARKMGSSDPNWRLVETGV